MSSSIESSTQPKSNRTSLDLAEERLPKARALLASPGRQKKNYDTPEYSQKLSLATQLTAEEKMVSGKILNALIHESDAIDFYMRKIEPGLRRIEAGADGVTLPQLLQSLPIVHRLKNLFSKQDLARISESKVLWNAFEVVYPELLKEYRAFLPRKQIHELIGRIEALCKRGRPLDQALALTQIHRDTYEGWRAQIEAQESERIKPLPRPKIDEQDFRIGHGAGGLPLPGSVRAQAMSMAAPAERRGCPEDILKQGLTSLTSNSRMLNKMEQNGILDIEGLLSIPRSELENRSGGGKWRQFGEQSIIAWKRALEAKHPFLGMLFSTCRELGIPSATAKFLEERNVETGWQLCRLTPQKLSALLSSNQPAIAEVMEKVDQIRRVMNSPAPRR